MRSLMRSSRICFLGRLRRRANFRSAYQPSIRISRAVQRRGGGQENPALLAHGDNFLNRPLRALREDRIGHLAQLLDLTSRPRRIFARINSHAKRHRAYFPSFSAPRKCKRCVVSNQVRKTLPIASIVFNASQFSKCVMSDTISLVRGQSRRWHITKATRPLDPLRRCSIQQLKCEVH